MAHCVIKNEVSCQSVCAKSAVGMYEKGSVENTVYGSYFLIVFFWVWYENLSAEPYSRFGKRIWYETFFEFMRKRFNTEPLVRNLYFSFSYIVWCETSFFPKPKKDRIVYRGEEPF